MIPQDAILALKIIRGAKIKISKSKIKKIIVI